MIIAIDGPAGSGKSTIAQALAEQLSLLKLDTGAMYRAVAWCADQAGIDIHNESAVSAFAKNLTIAFEGDVNHPSVLANGVDVTNEIRTAYCDSIVSVVAAYPGVRSAMVCCQRAVALGHNVVAEGRDIGTVVFPHADVKIFLVADPYERARRRVLQRHPHQDLSTYAFDDEVKATYESILERDERDSSRAAAPLKPAPDAVVINSTSASVSDIVTQISQLIQEVHAE